MKISPDTAKYFYHTSKLSTVIGNDQKRSILRIGALPLAELSGKEASSAKLLATDEMDSVLIASTPDGKQSNHNYTAFGYNDELPSGSAAMGFNGECILENMHLYLLGQGHRGFSTETGRFIAPDNAESPFGRGGVNSFAYCLNDPLNRKDETGMWSLFKPRTWFRSNQEKISQRLERIKTINSTLETETSSLNALVKKKQYYGKTLDPQIQTARDALQKTLGKSLNKAKGINKYADEDYKYIFPEQTKAQTAIKNSKPNVNRPPVGNTEKRNMFNNTRKHADAYDDNNYKFGLSDINTSTRQQ
nr:RHS repeat-associated core domain-containing protein [uncultured Pseudomonas sp.]